MRLTLRTLLAYMDDILDPADREELSTKIESSEFASDLLHKTRDSMRRLRLGAPTLSGPGMGADANAVAEYLDNTLAPEDVADFERICLESDVHLAEAASCHEILTMVLGEPAEVDSETRQRMYDLPLNVDDEDAHLVHQAHLNTETQAAREAVATIQTSSSGNVPDYLRPSFVQRHRGKLAIAAALLLGGIVYLLVTDPPGKPPKDMDEAEVQARTQAPPSVDFDPGDEAAEDGTTDPTAEGADFQATAGSEAPPFQPPAIPPSDAGQGDDTPGGESPVAEPPAGKGPDGADPTPEIPVIPEVVVPAVDLPSVDVPGPGEGTPARTDTAPEAPAEAPDNLRLPDSATVPDRGANALAPPVPEGATPGRPLEEVLSGAQPTLPTTETPAAQDGQLTRADVAPPASAPKVVATYVGTDDILLRYDANDLSWKRLSPGAQLLDGDLIFAAPATRSKIQLAASGITMDLVSGTRVRLSPENPDGLPQLGESPTSLGIEVIYGRVVLIKSAQSDQPLMIRLGDQVATARLEDAATLALQVQRELVPGADPTTTEAQVTTHFFATSGTVKWGAENWQRDVAAPADWQLVDGAYSDPGPLADTTETDWIDKPAFAGYRDVLALDKIREALVPGGDVGLMLQELVSSQEKRHEVRSLAARMSVHVGQFDAFVAALNDRDQRAAWTEHIKTLREALALAPTVAAEVRDAFVKRKGQENGQALYRMLRGYSKQEFAAGALAEQVHRLNDDSLDFRVLAFHNLKEATGLGLNYQPDHLQNARLRAYRTWKDRLDSGELLRRLEAN